MKKFSPEVQDYYLNIVAIERLGTYESIVDYANENKIELGNACGNGKGIKKCLSEKFFKLPLDKFLELEEEMADKKEEIDKIFKNQYSSNPSRKKGFGSFKNFYTWYVEQGAKCHYCGTSKETLKKLFDDEKLVSSKFNETLHIEQIDPKKGYLPENCRLSCSLCNNAKSDLISKENYDKYFSDAMRNFLSDLEQGKITNITFQNIVC